MKTYKKRKIGGGILRRVTRKFIPSRFRRYEESGIYTAKKLGPFKKIGFETDRINLNEADIHFIKNAIGIQKFIINEPIYEEREVLKKSFRYPLGRLITTDKFVKKQKSLKTPNDHTLFEKSCMKHKSYTKFRSRINIAQQKKALDGVLDLLITKMKLNISPDLLFKNQITNEIIPYCGEVNKMVHTDNVESADQVNDNLMYIRDLDKIDGILFMKNLIHNFNSHTDIGKFNSSLIDDKNDIRLIKSQDDKIGSIHNPVKFLKHILTNKYYIMNLIKIFVENLCMGKTFTDTYRSNEHKLIKTSIITITNYILNTNLTTEKINDLNFTDILHKIEIDTNLLKTDNENIDSYFRTFNTVLETLYKEQIYQLLIWLITDFISINKCLNLDININNRKIFAEIFNYLNIEKLNEEYPDKHMFIISHSKFMTNFMTMLDNLKNIDELGINDSVMPTGVVKQVTYHKIAKKLFEKTGNQYEFNNLDIIHLIIDKGGQIKHVGLYRYIRDSHSYDCNIDNYNKEDGSNIKDQHIFIMRHCGSCHNYKHGPWGTIRYKGVYYDSSKYSSCFPTDIDDIMTSGNGYVNLLRKFIDIKNVEDLNKIQFGSSIIFRSVITSYILQKSIQKELNESRVIGLSRAKHTDIIGGRKKSNKRKKSKKYKKKSNKKRKKYKKNKSYKKL
tara:strand:- start:35 stop:2056 length:2022 start_codon:yes stop_codon:yes gene_type:complete